MSCILQITGENFDVDDFLSKTELLTYSISYKGFPKFEKLPAGKKNEHSGCSIEVSKAGFNNFSGQVEDVIKYLKENVNSLQIIRSTPGIQFAYLNFGVDYDINKWVQSHYLPPELLTAVANLNIGIEISIYQPGE